MKVVCIVQARVGSTRLPGKVLKKICGKTVLEHDISRLKRVKNIDEIIIATTVEEGDIAIANEATRLGVKCFRGSEEDVLERYYFAARDSAADIVVRVTSDCPLIDPEVTEKVIATFLNNAEKVDYVSNTLDRTYPRGFDTEVFSMKALEKAFLAATEKSEREHVTPYIWKNKQLFRNLQVKNHEDFSNIRLTLDTEEDLEVITKVYEKLYEVNKMGFKEIINLFALDSELLNINSKVRQKEV